MLHQQNTSSTSTIAHLALKAPLPQRMFATDDRHALPTDSCNRTASNLLEAHISTTTSIAVSLWNTALSPVVAPPALSNQPQLDSHSTVATSAFLPDDWHLLLTNPLLFGHLQDWQHPVSLFDEGTDSVTLMMQNDGLGMDITQSQPAQSHLHLPQIDWGSNQEPPLPYNIQTTIPVSIITYLQSAREILGVFELTSADLILPGRLLGPTPNRDFTGRWLHLRWSSAGVKYLSLPTIQRAILYRPSARYESGRTLPATPST